MPRLLFRKDWSSSANNTERVPPSALIDMQNDIASLINGGLTDSNFASSAAIVESKLAFDTNVGHNHDGVNSRLLSSVNATITNAPHIRNGLKLSRYDQSTIQVSTGYIVIDGALLRVTSPTLLNMSTSGTFVTGSESASAMIYVYAYNAGTASNPSIDLKFSTEAPDLGNTDDGTAEFPLRYQKYSSIYYRCLGACFNNSSSHIDDGSVVSFDASSYAYGYFTADGTAKTVTTIWTPTYITAHYTNTTAADNNAADMNETTADLLSVSLVATSTYTTQPDCDFHTSTSRVGAAKTITAQSAGTSGSFVIHNPASGKVVYWEAIHAGTRGA